MDDVIYFETDEEVAIYIEGEEPAGASNHSHHNKNILDKISQKDIDRWNSEGGSSGGGDGSGSSVEIIDNLVSLDIDKALSANQGRVLAERIGTVPEGMTVTMLIEAAKQSAIAAILGGAVDADYDTLQEVAAWIASDTTASAELIIRVTDIEKDYLKSTDKTDLIQLISSNYGDVNGKINSVRGDLTAHITNKIVHITADERTNWNAKVDTDYVDEKIGDIETVLDSIISIQNELIGGEGV